MDSVEAANISSERRQRLQATLESGKLVISLQWACNGFVDLCCRRRLMATSLLIIRYVHAHRLLLKLSVIIVCLCWFIWQLLQ